MADDLEKAILISFNYVGGVDPGLKEQANAYIGSIKQAQDCWRLCIERFSVTAYPEVKFWCLQTLLEAIKGCYASYDAGTKSTIKSALLTWLQRDCGAKSTALPAPFLRNKLAQCLVAIVQLEYPDTWPTFFHDLISATKDGPGIVDMFCRILISVDEDIISLDIPRSPEGSRLSMAVKDAMREHSIAEVAQAWYELASQYAGSSPDLAALVLHSMTRYINWMDINLVANDKFTGLLFTLMESPSTAVRGAAADCLLETLSKRMEPVPKLALVQQLRVVPLLGSWSARLATNSTAANELDGDMEELLVKHARLLATTATEILDSLKKVENGVISLSAMGFNIDKEAAAEASEASSNATQLLTALFPALLEGFNCGMDEVALPLLPFMTGYLARLKTVQKRSQGLPAEALQHLRLILKGLAACARYPQDSACGYEGLPPSQADVAAAQEERAAVEEKRRDLFILYRNVSKLEFAETAAFVRGCLQDVTAKAAATWQEVEVAVVLLYELGEGAPEAALKPPNGVLCQLSLALMQASLPAAQHHLVALTALETYVRYCRVLQHNTHIIPTVLAAFLDARGLGHPSEDVSTRACYLFARLVKVLRANLRPYIGSMLQSLRPHLSRVATSLPPVVAAGTGTKDASGKALAPATALVDDRLYVFEAVGLLLGQDEVAAEEQQALLTALLQPLLQQIEGSLQRAATSSASASGTPPRRGPPSPNNRSSFDSRLSPEELITQALEAITRLSKGFKADTVTRSRAQIGAMFVKCLETGVQAPKVFPANKVLRARFISLLHRMVELLGTTVMPFLPTALEVLVHTQSDAPDMCDVLSLLNQLIVRFKDALEPLLEQLMPVLISRVHGMLDASWDWSGRMAAPGSNGSTTTATFEDAREKGEVQRGYYGLLFTLAQNNLAPSLLHAPHAALDAMMGGLTRGAATHVDPTVRRTCVQVFERLVSEWCTQGEVLPGFKRFAMERLGGEACIAGLMRGGLDARDAATVALLGEVATALKLIYDKCGDEFPAHLCSVVLPAVGCPPAVAQQLVYHLRESDAKQLKECLRTVLLQSAATAGSGGK